MREIKKIPPATKVSNKSNSVVTHNVSNDIQLNSCKITVRISILLIDKLKNIVISNKSGGNFEYTNASDFMRNALNAYKNGMTLIAQRTNDDKKETSFRVSKELKDFYCNLPQNAKSEIIERAINTYIKHKL